MCMISLIINSMNTIRKIISNIAFHIFSLILCGGLVAYAYYSRIVLKCSFMKLYIAGYIGLILSFLIFLVAYKDKEADTKTCIRESISGYIFFLFFMAGLENIAINIEYRAIPKEFTTIIGKTLPKHAPTIVPSVQPT